MIHEHYEAVKTLMPAGVKVFLYDAELSEPPAVTDYPYVVLWGDPGEEFSGDPGDRTSADQPDQLQLGIRATYAALSGEALSIIAGVTRRALNRARPVVAGRGCSRLKQSVLQPMETDRSLVVGSRHPVFAVDEYSLTSASTTSNTQGGI